MTFEPTAFNIGPTLIALVLAGKVNVPVIVLLLTNRPLVAMICGADMLPTALVPVAVTTRALAVPPMPTVTLPPLLTTVTLLVPLLMFELDVLTPVNRLPLPRM